MMISKRRVLEVSTALAGAAVVGFGIGTQYVAWRLGYQSALGNPVALVGTLPVYPPWRIIEWLPWRHSIPDIGVGLAITAGCAVVPIWAWVASFVFSPLALIPLVARNIRCSDFRISDLVCSDHPITCYLQVRPTDAMRLRPLTRLILTQVAQALMYDTDAATDGRTKRHRLLYLLEEVPSLGQKENGVGILTEIPTPKSERLS